MSRDSDIRRFLLRPIPSDADLDRAISVVDALFDREALDACGHTTIVALQLNRPAGVAARRRWASLGWHPPND